MPKEVDAITKLYGFLLWIIPKLEKFPRSQKFLIADLIETVLLDVLDLLIESAYSKKKSTLLRSANLKLEQLRYLIRLSKDLKFLSLKNYELCARACSWRANVRAGNRLHILDPATHMLS